MPRVPSGTGASFITNRLYKMQRNAKPAMLPPATTSQEGVSLVEMIALQHTNGKCECALPQSSLIY